MSLSSIIWLASGILGLIASVRTRMKEKEISKKAEQAGYDRAVNERNTSFIYSLQSAKESENEIGKLTDSELREYTRTGIMPKSAA